MAQRVRAIRATNDPPLAVTATATNSKPSPSSRQRRKSPTGLKRWHGWLLSTIIPSLCVLFHFVSLTERDETASFEEARPLPPASESDPSAQKSAPALRSFVDHVWSEWGSEESQFQTLVPPSEIDYTIKNRLPWEQRDRSSRKPDAIDEKCGDILLFMPQMFARNGHGSQLNSYLLAAMLATFLGKAMVILEAPQKHSRYPNGSQFGCPVDAFKNPEEFLNFKGSDHGQMEMRSDFPRGIDRLIVHPSWISRDCGIPTCNTFDYNSWDAIRKAQRDYYLTGLAPKEIKCNEKGEESAGEVEVMVTVMGGEEVRQYFDRQYKKQMLDRSSRGARKRAYQWAIRLGATHYQATVFSTLKEESDIWDYLSALLARSGLVTFQPWIARDVKEFIKSSHLPLDLPHDSIHVRRGDKLTTESREEVVNYWHSQGYERQVDFPLNYIVSTSLQILLFFWQWENDCLNFGTAKKRRGVRTIYLATDDPDTVKEEIKRLPRGLGGTTIVGGVFQSCSQHCISSYLHSQCFQRVKFVLSPDAHHGSFHLSEGGVKSDCVERYKRNIHSIADLMILTKSNTFVGEFNSNWGRIVRIFRAQLNDMYVMPDNSFSWKGMLGLNDEKESTPKDENPVVIHDIRLAFAEDKPIPPPGW
ncbi:hypothetical protein ACHAWF_008939 [Thalassiosira exigua]